MRFLTKLEISYNQTKDFLKINSFSELNDNLKKKVKAAKIKAFFQKILLKILKKRHNFEEIS